MIKNDEHLLDDLDRRLKFFDGHVDSFTQSSPSFFDVIDLIDIECARVWAVLCPNLFVHFNTSLLHKVFHCISERIRVACSATVIEPSDTLEADADIDDLDVKFLTRTVRESLVLHEHHVTDLKTFNEVFNRGSEVTTTSPHIFDEGNVIWVDAELLGQPSVVEFNTFFFKEFVILGRVKNLDAEHDEARIVTAGQANVIQVIEAGAELRANEWICRRVQLTGHTVWLEAEDSCSYVVNIISPASNNRIPLNAGAWYASRGQTAFET